MLIKLNKKTFENSLGREKKGFSAKDCIKKIEEIYKVKESHLECEETDCEIRISHNITNYVWIFRFKNK